MDGTLTAPRKMNLLRSPQGQSVPAINPELATPFTDIDLDRPGKQIDFIHFPHSPHEDAWGTVMVPIAVIGNGNGPTILLEGGNHGDEYEGPIVLGELIRNLHAEDVTGKLLIVPAINAPAVSVGRRTSPLDGKNMNRVFPGDHGGTITDQIAAYVSDQLITRSDALLSLHSGGSSLNILPSTIVQPSADTQQFERSLEAATKFGAPVCVVMNNLGDRRLCVSSAMAAGLTCVSTEMAGGGVVNLDALALCRDGVLDVLEHWGVLGKKARTSSGRQQATRQYEMRGTRAYVITSERGVFEPCAKVGDAVSTGDLAGRVHFLTSPVKTPVPLHFQETGIVYGVRQFGTVEPGSTCAVVASPRA